MHNEELVLHSAFCILHSALTKPWPNQPTAHFNSPVPQRTCAAASFGIRRPTSIKRPDGWVVKVELAGVSPEDIQIEIQDNVLYIAGCRKDRSCASGISYQQMEITYSNFEKTLRFPAPIDGATIEHVFENGLLIINLRKA